MAEKLRDPVLPVVLVLLLACLLAAAYYYWIRDGEPLPAPQAPPVAEAPPAPTEPPIRHPIQRPEAEAVKPLPPLAESDAPLQDAAAGLSGKELERYFYLNNIVRRVVVTIDDLPRKKLSQRYNVAKPVPGQLLTAGQDDRLALNPKNYQRYTPYIRLAENVDATKLVALYIRFYPLFQEEYKNLGNPKKYFNDRLVETIDHLLAAPEIKAPVKLVQPKVYYQYADPNLEALSAGHKLMIRIGPENGARVKAKLQEIRSVLLAAG